jgi:hypothetical protein
VPLQALHTFGFRGEALSSLAALGELSVITRTADQAAATRLEFDHSGHLSSSSPVARAVGTTVAVKDLFAALPVRRQVRALSHCVVWYGVLRGVVWCGVVWCGALYISCCVASVWCEVVCCAVCCAGLCCAVLRKPLKCAVVGVPIPAGVFQECEAGGCQAEAAAAAVCHHDWTGVHGMAWHGAAWHGTAWHGMAWGGMAWHGMAWHGAAWHGMAWHCITQERWEVSKDPDLHLVVP